MHSMKPSPVQELIALLPCATDQRCVRRSDMSCLDIINARALDWQPPSGSRSFERGELCMQRVTSAPGLEALALPAITVVDNLVRERLYSVSFTIPEFTCVCPMTGQPDFATLHITYMPDASLIELKALKLYINAYRN